MIINKTKKMMLMAINQLALFGIDLFALKSLKNILLYLKQRKEWIIAGGNIDKNLIVLKDYFDSAGSGSGHYFHQDLLVATAIHKQNPARHVDIGSRIDGFVAHVASFRKIEVYDVRKLPDSMHQNIVYRQVDFMCPQNLTKTDSLSCLHALEHFGMGRYLDPININGHIDGLKNMIKMLTEDGRLYLSLPIGKRDSVCFNAHRVFHPLTILEYEITKKNLKLEHFHYVDDVGVLSESCDPNDIASLPNYGLGIYQFIKISKGMLS